MASNVNPEDRKEGAHKIVQGKTTIFANVVQIGNKSSVSYGNDDCKQLQDKTHTPVSKPPRTAQSLPTPLEPAKPEESKSELASKIGRNLEELDIARPKHGGRHSDTSEHPDDETRMIVFGKTGSGKSATCNTIIGRQRFKDAASLSSITSTCCVHERIRNGRQITVVDTPGMFDTDRTQAETIAAVVDCISCSLPGPHAFLLILSCRSRFTDEEYNTMRSLKSIFGEDVFKYAIVIFSNADALVTKLKTEFLESSPTNLRYILEMCENRVIFFNNDDSEKEKEKYVKELQDMVDEMRRKNCGQYYTHSMFKAHFTSAEKIAKAMAEHDFECLKQDMKTLIKLSDNMKLDREQVQQQILDLSKKVKSSDAFSQREMERYKKEIKEYQKQLEEKDTAITKIQERVRCLEKKLNGGEKKQKTWCILQ